LEIFMRELTGHKVNPANDVIKVEALDGPGPGGASHEYSLTLPDGSVTKLNFQNGPINDVGVNGITHETLLAILVDRMEGFQSGQFACRENALALTKLQEAQHWLHHRTLMRMARGVEGTHKL
jgi:hypothetical protein